MIAAMLRSCGIESGSTAAEAVSNSNLSKLNHVVSSTARDGVSMNAINAAPRRPAPPGAPDRMSRRVTRGPVLLV